MFINIVYKDAPELSATIYRQSSDPDVSVEKMLLVNPNCPVRIMLEYIRNKRKLGVFSKFDLCDDTGRLLGLFDLPTYAYATEQFEHKKSYYVIVFKEENDRRVSILPQLNHDNDFYLELKERVKRFITTGGASPVITSPAVKSMSPSVKSTPQPTAKPNPKKK